MISYSLIFAVLAAGALGFFAPMLAARIVANYPGTWADVICGKQDKNVIPWLVRGISSILLLASSFLLVFAGAPVAIAVLTAFMFAVAVLTDLRARLIPDIITFPLVLIGAAAANDLPWITGGLTEGLVLAAAGYIIASALGALYYKRSDAAIGGGDIKLIAAGGLFLGATGLAAALVVSAALAAVFRGKSKFIPFAPFFAAGAIAYIAFYLIFP